MKNREKMKKKYLILTIICILLIFTSIPKLIENRKGKNIEVTTSALLNKKYIPQINSIYVGDSVDVLHFYKSNDIWLCNYGDINFYANEKIVLEMIENFSKNRTLTTIDSNIKNHNLYGISEESSFNISFYNEDLAGNKNEFSKIYFGYENSDRTTIYLKGNRNPTVYSAQNDLYSYFSTQLEHYGNNSFFPLANNSTEKSISKIEIFDYSQETNLENSKKIKYRGDSDFEDFVYKTFSSLGGKFYTEDILASDNMIHIKKINLYDDKNQLYTLDIYSYFNNIEEQYFIKTSFPEKTSDVNYVLEISQWTKSRFD